MAREHYFLRGLPSSFWGEASNHFTFVKNQIPIHRVERNGKKVFISPFEKLFGQPGMPLRYLMPFGTAVSVFLPKETRRGPKTPSQQKAYEGVLIGFAEGMKGYRVLDSDNRIHEESFNFCSFSENVFPGHLDGVVPKDASETQSFYPRKEDFLNSDEWQKFEFDQEEEEDVLRDPRFLIDLTESEEQGEPESEEKGAESFSPPEPLRVSTPREEMKNRGAPPSGRKEQKQTEQKPSEEKKKPHEKPKVPEVVPEPRRSERIREMEKKKQEEAKRKEKDKQDPHR